MDQQLEEATALQQFKQLINEKSDSLVSASDNISIWGVTLQPDTNDDRTDVILRKFLRVKDFRVQDAFDMFSSTIQWRKDFRIEELLLEDDDDTNSVDFGRAFFTSGRDREGHPVLYTVAGAFQDIEFYNNSFSDDAKRQRFLEWRILFMEKAVRKLDFKTGGISTMVHVIDMKNSVGRDKTELAVAIGSAGKILSNNYPEFFKRQIIINVPWWRMAVNNIRRPFMPQLSNLNLVFVRPSNSSDTLWKYIGVRQIPTRCEGLTKRDGEFRIWGGYAEVTTKPEAPKQIIALQQFKQLIKEKSDSLISASGEISIWGVTLQPDTNDDRTDVILRKFLQVRHFRVQDAFNMFFSTIQWRKDFRIDELLLEDEDDAYSNDLERAFFVFGQDKTNHPVCYTVFDALQDDELYPKLFSDEAKKQRFVNWTILFREKTIRKLDFRSRGISTMVHVMDWKNHPRLRMPEMNATISSTFEILSDHYPGFFEKQIIINVPWWSLALIYITNPFAPEWVIKKKMVFVGPSKSGDALLKYIDVKQIPARYECLTKGDNEFETSGASVEVTMKRGAPCEISIWGVTLQPDTNDDKTDAILRKFLRVKDFRVQDAFNMLSSTIQWRKDFCIEELLLEDDDDTNPVDFGRAFFTSGHDREGHPVCYTVPRPFEDIELYNNSFSDDAKRQRFLKWRILFMEKAVRKLDFRSDEISTMVHVIDMKNFTGHDKTELAVAFGSVIQILSNHYPGFFKTQIIINMPWWRLALHNITRPFKPQLSKSKLVFVGTSKSSDTLWEYIGVRQIPTRCEGLTKRNNEFGTWGDSTELCYQLVLMDRQLEEATALQQFKQLIDEKSDSLVSASDNISIWGVTLQPDTNDDSTDAILRKFLRVKDFRVQDAFDMFSSTIQWRKDFRIDELLLEDDDDTNSVDLGKAFFISGHDREGHPVCYTVFQALEDTEFYNSSFSGEAKRERFLKWRILFMEKAVRKLDFRSDETSTMVHVIDMENFLVHDKTELTVALGSEMQILSNNYPGFFKTQIIINVPWWGVALYNITRPFKAPLSKSKLVFVGPSKSSDTLWEYIGVRQIPTRCEGLTKRNNEFGAWSTSTEVTLKRAAKSSASASASVRVQDAFDMLSSTIQWRKDFRIEELLLEDDADTNLVNFGRAFFTSGHDREGRPVCYTVFRALEDTECYNSLFSDDAKRQRFSKWRILFMEKAVRKLDFTTDETSTLVHVVDLKNYMSLDKTELKEALGPAVQIISNNYPGFFKTQIIINVPWWNVALHNITSPFRAPLSKSKLVFVVPSKSSDTLWEYIGVRQIPTRCEGLTKRNNELGASGDSTEVTLKRAAKCTLTRKIKAREREMCYGAEFKVGSSNTSTAIVKKKID
ncbi:PATL3 [Linum grandiflorum]